MAVCRPFRGRKPLIVPLKPIMISLATPKTMLKWAKDTCLSTPCGPRLFFQQKNNSSHQFWTHFGGQKPQQPKRAAKGHNSGLGKCLGHNEGWKKVPLELQFRLCSPKHSDPLVLDTMQHEWGPNVCQDGAKCVVGRPYWGSFVALKGSIARPVHDTVCRTWFEAT